MKTSYAPSLQHDWIKGFVRVEEEGAAPTIWPFIVHRVEMDDSAA